MATEGAVDELLSAPLALLIVVFTERYVDTPEFPGVTPEVLGVAVAQATRFLSHFRADYQRVVRALHAMAPTLTPRLTDLLRSRAAREWFSPLEPDRQVWVSRTNTRPESKRFDPVSAEQLESTQKPSGGFWTSTLSRTLDTAWTRLDYMPWSGSSMWQPALSHDVAAYEITSKGDWGTLASAYPSRTIRGSIDWQAVAAEWDAVHVTTAAVLQGHDSTQAPSVASSWDAEGTLWLRWCFADFEPIGLDAAPHRVPERRDSQLWPKLLQLIDRPELV